MIAQKASSHKAYLLATLDPTKNQHYVKVSCCWVPPRPTVIDDKPLLEVKWCNLPLCQVRDTTFQLQGDGDRSRYPSPKETYCNFPVHP